VLTPTRQKIKVFDLRFTLLSSGLLISISLLLVLLFKGVGSSSAGSSWKGEAEHWRTVATKLQAVGLNEQAAEYYQRYLQSAQGAPAGKSSVAFSLGELYEESQNFAEALAWYYQVELFDAKSTQKEAAGRKIVALLERLNKVSAAKQALAEETSLHAPTPEPVQGGKVVARIGDKNIYLHQVQASIDTLPAPLQEKARTKEGLAQAIRQFVADELLLAKAERLHLQDDAAVAKTLATLRRQVLLQKVIEEEVTKKVAIEPRDLENYYAAHRSNYGQKSSLALSLIKVKSEAEAKKITTALKHQGKNTFGDLARAHSLDEATKKRGGDLDAEVQAGSSFGNFPASVVDKLFAYDQGQWSEPILTHGAYYIFLVRKKNPGKVPPLSEVQEQVSNEYRREKAQDSYGRLMEDTLRGEKVEFFDEAKGGT
jgi:parvulin-like peptidyl-prolyl isomerase